MEKPKSGNKTVIHAIVGFLGLSSVSACVAAEFKRTKVEDLKLYGRLCSLPGSPAFGLGFAASICLLAAQIVGVSAIGRRFCDKDTRACISAQKKNMAIILVVLSWLCFGFAIMLLGVGSSMNRRQLYGQGWFDGECYVVKEGVYIGAAALASAAVMLTLGSSITMTTEQHI